MGVVGMMSMIVLVIASVVIAMLVLATWHVLKDR
jgi:hypothetical protein